MNNKGEIGHAIQWLKRVGYISLWSAAAVLFRGDNTLADTVAVEALPPPVQSSALFPCSGCHAQGRVLQKENLHRNIDTTTHPGQDYNCFSCHDKQEYDMLVLFNEEKVELIHSSELCGQCHSTTYHLWQSGLHGKITGKWSGGKIMTSCTVCHDPHQPAYRAQKPESPPTPPQKTLRWGQ
jgi:uncharacterized CHY-type Zn-finger protein